MNENIKSILDIYEQHIFGQRNNLKLLLTALLSGGHVLLEGVPGIGKTKMVKTIASIIGGEFRRIQFTPDLLPSDITGSAIYNLKEGTFQTLKGPIFTNILLADEINRTPAKTQAAMLEAMEERQVTINGETFILPEPFFVVATQNPVDYEGTYPLPEAQQDRFMFKLIVNYPSIESEKDVLRQSIIEQANKNLIEKVIDLSEFNKFKEQVQKVTIEDSIIDYITQIVRKTRESDLIRLGASPRAGIAILQSSKAWAFIEGRDYVTPDDIKMVVYPALRHRIIISSHLELEGGNSDQIIRDIVASTVVPR